MSKFCKKTMLPICKFSHPSYSKTGLKECELELIDHSTVPMNCNYVIFKIYDLTFVPLETENNYIVIPEEKTQIDTLCGVSKTLFIKEPSVLSSDESCTLTYGNSLMKIGIKDRSANFEIKYKDKCPSNSRGTNIATRSLSSSLRVCPTEGEMMLV